MLDNFSKVRVKSFNILTDSELIQEKDKAEKQWEYIQSTNIPPVIATTMMGKMEWYIGKVLEEMGQRDIEGGFSLKKEEKKLKLIKKHKMYKGIRLPNL